ncbi:glutamate--tRNA ligase [Patescibacteria group bacterium]|nr:glutamate--tRNA ligase [Patescibacteria group bacterium]
MQKIIKTRFAPSPTGDLHIGGLRTALYSYLFAKKNNSEFLLRIEDTDQARYQEGSIDSILDGLEWAGIKPDNIDNIPYQSSKIEIYQKYAKQLVNEGKAYYCFCSEHTLAEMRQIQEQNKQAPKYDRRCLKLTQEEVEEKIKKGEPHVIRMKIPEGKTKFIDLIRGEIKFDLKEIDDQILLKSDGYPTYHLANVIDDYEMEITHIIRGEDWLPSTPKHIILYNYFNWGLPEFAHIPLILAPDKSKLSKRHGATGVLEFKKLGYLPEALINYIALLGWNPGSDKEIFTLEKLELEFSLEKVHKAGAIFDQEKLDWMNGYYIRQLSLENFSERCMPYLIESKLIDSESPDVKSGSRLYVGKKYIQAVVALEQERIKKLSEISKATEYFFKEIEYNKSLLKWKKSDLETAKQRLEFLYEELEKIPNENWTRNSLENLLIDLIKAKDLGVGDTLWPLRVALTGQQNSPGPFEVAEVLGKETSLERIKKGINTI